MSPDVPHSVSVVVALGLDHLLLQTTTTQNGVGPEQLFDYVPVLVRIGWFLLGFLAVVVVGRFVVEPVVLSIVRRRNRHNPTLREAIRRYTRVVVFLVAVVVGAGVAGYVRFLTTSAVVVGAVTLAIGVAAQGVIGSIVSGVALVFDPEFNVGDYIEWSGGQGVVQTITLRVTRIRTKNGELVTVPNTILTSKPITRPFGRGNYRVVERIELAYEDDVDRTLDLLDEVTGDVEAILEAPSPRAFVDELGPNSVVVNVHYWIEDPDRSDVVGVRSTFARAVKRRLEQAGITISPATKRDLHGRIEIDERR